MSHSRPPCALRAVATSVAAFAILTLSAAAIAGYDRGIIDISQPQSADPVAFVWVPDSTSDGSGVSYLAFTAAYQHTGAANPSVQETKNFVSPTPHANLGDFVNWVVASNAHITSASQLTIHKRVVSLEPLP